MGGSTARQIVKLASGNIPCHGRHAQLMKGGWLGGGSYLFLSHFHEFECSLVQEFKLFSGCELVIEW